MKPKISLIAAVSKNGVIGKDNEMPWHLSEDLKYFKRITLNKPIIMGRKNHESIGMALPQRHNIVMTKSPEYFTTDCTVVNSVEDALDAAGTESEEIMIIGGAVIYDLFLPMADTMYITEIDKEFDGDTFFPEFNSDEWQETERISAPTENGIDYSFVIYKRK